MMKIVHVSDDAAQVSKAFAKNACIFGTEEFKLWREYKAVYPKAQMVVKTIKKNPNKKTRRNMTYSQRMRLFPVIWASANPPSAPQRMFWKGNIRP